MCAASTADNDDAKSQSIRIVSAVNADYELGGPIASLDLLIEHCLPCCGLTCVLEVTFLLLEVLDYHHQPYPSY